ncbi:phosphodiester glycosidase family protein [Sabulibacter ruber]|uniref:phosphodiester glycosidase family protein n=1 Tax=Sabulibacter ruber TaxID=2811901 RepID=UPI001A973775|nr:phosphodiester glycosidase family protein [Sabulibacter ruber]
MKKNVLLPIRVVLLAWLLLWVQPLFAQYTWTQPAHLNAGLPPSIKVFYSETPAAPGVTPLRMYYALIDLNDPNMEFKAVYGGGTGVSSAKTPDAWAALEKEPVYAVINGGFFNTTTYEALGTAVQEGNVLAINAKSTGGSYPTRSAFGVLPGNIADIAWIYHVGAANTMYQYPNPNPVDQLTKQPTATYPEGAALWPASTAIGAGPVLVHNGVKRMTKDEELMWASGDNREPRSAIGRTADNKVILMVVEGRNDGISAGLTLPQMADVLVSIGAQEAMNLDGGGSSALTIKGKNTIRPSDAGLQRAVPTALILKRRTHVYDTDNTALYAERGAWSESSNTGFYGTSKARVLATGDGSSYASYKLKGISAGRYELSAWWVAASNRSTNTPYIIYRTGGAAPDTVRVNQTLNGSKFNVLGTFDLGPNDSVVISNQASGQFVSADAISLVKVEESMPAIAFSNGTELEEVVQDRTSSFDLLLTSPNSGFTVQKLRIFKKVGDNPEQQVGGDIPLNGSFSHTYSFSYAASDPLGPVHFRFELEDSFGRTVSKNFEYRVVSLTQVVFKGGKESGRHAFGQPLNLDLSLETRVQDINLKELKVFKSVDGGSEQQLGSTIALNAQPQQDYTFTHKLEDAVNSNVNFRFEVTDVRNTSASRTYQVKVMPARGDFRLAVISDLNSGFGSVTYEWQVDSIMQRIPRLWQPDMVVAGGDMIAGQSASLNATQVANMWNGFDNKVAKPLREAGIPFAFTMGNHDAAAGMPVDRQEALNYWRKPGNFPNWHPVDTTNYPFYFSYKPTADSDIFFVSWEASSANISNEQLAWVRAQFSSPAAKAAKFRFLVGHLPLYGVAQEYNSAGNILNNAAALQAMMEELDVHTYISGHHHAYYPGKHGGVEFMNAGAAGSGPRKYLGYDAVAPNTVTLMDVFLEQDTIIYTTFEIKHPDADAMPVFNEKSLPEVIVGANGHLIRRDVPISGAAAGTLSSYNKRKATVGQATGTVEAVEVGNDIRFVGSFSGLKGAILPEKTAVALYQGLYPEEGTMKLALKVESKDGRNGTFTGSLPADYAVKELMSMGAFYVLIKTDSLPEGEVRTQLYKPANAAPAMAVITSHDANTVYPVRNIKGFFSVKWNAEADAERNTVTYTYQLAKDAQFNQLLLHQPVGLNAEYSVPQEEWFALLGDAPANQAVTFYHRVIASDGKNVSISAPVALQLTKSDAPITGPVEIPAAGFVYDCRVKDPDGNCIAAFAPAPTTNGHGVTVDRKGKVWSVGYSRGVRVNNPDGTPWEFTSDKLEFYQGNKSYLHFINFKGLREEVRLVTGIGLAHDGNILVAFNTILYKLDVNTGEPLARVDTDISLTNPTSDDKGNIFVTSVTGNKSYIFKQSATDSTAFETVVTLADATALSARTSGSVARASAISPEGNTLYVPYISGNKIDKYTSTNGTTWKLEETIRIVSNSKSIFAASNNRMYAVVDASGDQPAKLIFRDDSNPAQKLSWTLPLPEIHGTDLRGLTLSPGLDTAYIISSAVGNVYRYVLPSGGNTGDEPRELREYTIAQAREKDAAGKEIHVGEYVLLRGVVASPNLSSAHLDLSLMSGGKAVQLYRATKGARTFTPQPKDSVAAIGMLRNYNGLLRVEVDSLFLLQANSTLPTRATVTSIGEELESVPVTIHQAFPVDKSQWTTGVGYHGFEVTLESTAGIINMLVPSTSSVYNLPAPSGMLKLEGVVRQYKDTPPYTTGYYLVPLQFKSEIGPRKDKDALSVKVYPVPTTTGTVYVELPQSVLKGASIQVMNMFGRVLLTKGDFTDNKVALDLSRQQPGTYLVVVNTVDGRTVHRVMKE